MRHPGPLTRAIVRGDAFASAARRATPSLIVLIFHRVLAEIDPLMPGEPDEKRFAAQMDLVGSCFSVLHLEDAARRLKEGRLPPRAACVTFDDGYANNFEVALPVLARKGIPATVFVSPGFLDGGRMFNDTVIEAVRRAPVHFDLRAEGLGEFRLSTNAARRATVDALLGRIKFLETAERLAKVDRIAELACSPLPEDLMMTSDQLRRLHRAGVEIGAHTIDHPILTSIDDESAMRQICGSKERLESILQTTIRTFAYPNGRPVRDYASRHVSMVRDAGFEVAVSTATGSADDDADLLQIPRVASWHTVPLRYGLSLAMTYGTRDYELA